ncbi:dTDP-4-dehydrorhamnose reductase [Paenibacillus sp. EKM102P]|uniref:dTDP-4-dehydrorhamnose reductase n=1 Tax=unclassified Paenibacillus TaxID=185978 RepID=UPI00142DA646|nr:MULTISPECIES: dTDP-4-dehydrorhamnose reductase [unclassified Paenibacillus]KAF6621074.1 dTDP-4-dehydrorhamnose reductase [Paenibacillus sp. EKM101P]KAF6622378.1 dTDP-4-dehydrorhamnose reductase [Paenibacillus sp. EKM102P]KAF6632226.1 dTDP-4-dehydrorhamnose reductase [Paenibacillus sp. EKM10P]KAF6646982.1 dTDP-4-dehydrorhamnose reductase [Paenibacillus sp. EKM11P]
MRILVTGASGQLGKDVVKVFQEQGHDVVGYDRDQLDITDLDQAMKIVGQYQPEAVIHCAAYTAVDAAETDLDTAYQVNAAGTRNMVLAAEKAGAKLVYISTDYVFDGTAEQPYHEYDNTNPQSIYGKSKRAGEVLTQTLSSRYFIVRTSWVYGLYGNNFVKTMLKLGQEKPHLQVVNDQKGSPTYTVDLVRFLAELVQTEKYGVYHASNSGSCTWYEFTQAIFKEAVDILDATITATLEPCSTDQFPRPAARPKNSVMEHIAIRTNGLNNLRHWREGLHCFIKELADFRNIN